LPKQNVMRYFNAIGADFGQNYDVAFIFGHIYFTGPRPCGDDFIVVGASASVLIGVEFDSRQLLTKLCK